MEYNMWNLFMADEFKDSAHDCMHNQLIDLLIHKYSVISRKER